MPDPDRYVRGDTYARRDLPRFEFKAGATGYTGGGYARVRSTERREHTPGDGTDDVFVSVHRLAAVAWHLPDGTLGDDVSLSLLDGCDVHHTQPDGDETVAGMPAANGAAWTVLTDHGRHSAITQSEMRAWAADARRSIERDDDGGNGCPKCGGAVDGDGAAVGERDGLCLDCATDVAEATGEAVKL